MKKWAGDTYIGPVSPTQALTYQFIKSGYYEPNLKKIKELYAPRLAKALEVLDRELPGAVYPRPEGGFFIGVTLPEGNDMATLIPRGEGSRNQYYRRSGFLPESGRRKTFPANSVLRAETGGNRRSFGTVDSAVG